MGVTNNGDFIKYIHSDPDKRWACSIGCAAPKLVKQETTAYCQCGGTLREIYFLKYGNMPDNKPTQWQLKCNDQYYRFGAATSGTLMCNTGNTYAFGDLGGQCQFVARWKP